MTTPVDPPTRSTAATRRIVTTTAAPHVLMYSAQPAALTTIVALAMAMALTIAPLVGVLLQAVIWAAAYRYAVEVFERSANGSAVAPEFAIEQDSIGWKLLLLQLACSAFLWWLRVDVASAGLRWLGMAFIALLQPAMTMIAAMNRSLAAAFDPVRLLRLVPALGLDYALLVIAGLALAATQQGVASIAAGGRAYVLVVVGGIGLGGAQQVQGALTGNWMLVLLGQCLAGFIWAYAVVSNFHWMGKIVFTHSRALGFTPVEEQRLLPETRHAPLMQRIERKVAEGDIAAAASELERCLTTEMHTSPGMHARYRELLLRVGDRDRLLAHARMRIDALMVAGSEREALALLRESLAADPQFRPASPERTTGLALAAERLGQHELALTLLCDFTQRHPRDPEIPANATLAARLLVERQSDLACARAILQAAIERMLPAHPQYMEMLDRRNAIDAMIRNLPRTGPTAPPGKS